MAGKKKILIVDDEVDILKLLEARLVSSGYEVLKADNGLDAVSLAKTKHPDLIILDIMLPHMDGTTVSQNIREDEYTKDIPIIFLTALHDKENEKPDHRVGRNIVFAKPFDAKELLVMIKQLTG